MKKDNEIPLTDKDGQQLSHSSLAQSAAIASILVAFLLASSKLVAWIDEQSISILASFTDSLIDICASVVSFIAIRVAYTPADEDHQFGHGKAESLSALMQAAFIFGSAVMLAVQGVERLLNPVKLETFTTSGSVMLFSIVLTVVLVLYQRWVAKKTGSLAVAADSAHYVGDILANIAVLFALLAVYWGIWWLDPVVALVIVLILLYSAFDIIKDALAMLMDQSLPVEDVNHIKDLVTSVKGVLGVHDIKTRKSGRTEFIQLHVEMAGQLVLQQAHELGDKIEIKVKQNYPNADIIIHHDPV